MKIPLGINCPFIKGNVLYACPALRPATKPPDRAVTKSKIVRKTYTTCMLHDSHPTFTEEDSVQGEAGYGCDEWPL